MQFKIEDTKPEFEPIRVSLTLETESELCDILARLGICSAEINARYVRYKYAASAEHRALWAKLDDIAQERGLHA